MILGGLSGRIDHTLSSFDALLRFHSICDCPVFIVDDINLVTLLHKVFFFDVKRSLRSK